MRQRSRRFAVWSLVVLMLAWLAGFVLHPLTHHPLEPSSDCFVCTLQKAPAQPDSPLQQSLKALAPPALSEPLQVVADCVAELFSVPLKPLIPRAPPC
ncbi:hypothetical protein DCOP10_119183 [Armatimonadetes bacterium DC]|nr:hypothetical protein DCOP10_119183 [Armatimonadetes bacterium DC]